MTEQPTVEHRTSVGRRQLALIGGVVAAAAALGIALGVVLTGGRGAALSPAAGYVPADAVMYMEARLDLPGDQRANLRAVLERFPAADADAVLTDALADTLDELLADAGAPVDYSNDVASWFDGRIGIALLDYPLSADPMAMALPSTLVSFGSRDPDGATGLADELRGEMESGGMTFSSEEHDGVTIWSLDLDDEAMEMGVPVSGLGFAYAVTDDQLLLANGNTTLTTALDVHSGDGDSFAQRDGLASLVARLPGEVSGVVAVDVKGLMAETMGELEQQAPELADLMAGYVDELPSLSVSAISFETDAVRFDGASGMPTGDLAPSNERRDLASRVPADAILFGDAPRAGQSLAQVVIGLKSALAATPDSGMPMLELEQVEDALGADLEDFVAWINDAAVVAGWDGTAPYGGLLLGADDPDVARQRLDQLRALARLAAFGGSGDITVTTEDVEGVEVTTIAVDASGMDAQLTPAASTVIIEYAVDGDTALVGIGDGFVRRVLSLDEADSLAETDRFRGAVERFGGFDNVGTLFLDLASLREAVMEAAGSEMPTEMEPNIEPLDYLVSVTRVEGDELVARGALVLR